MEAEEEEAKRLMKGGGRQRESKDGESRKGRRYRRRRLTERRMRERVREREREDDESKGEEGKSETEARRDARSLSPSPFLPFSLIFGAGRDAAPLFA